jgi:ribosome-binding protein aMBF1 (putative translation factor)
MDELQAFIDEQKALDPEFAESFDEGYELFRRGVLLRQARESVGLTQEEIAGKLKTKSLLSPVSKITCRM